VSSVSGSVALNEARWCTTLQSLQCNKNMIVTLDVSACLKLLSLGSGENELTSLDVSKNTALQDLYCRVNQLATLDVKANTALRSRGRYSDKHSGLYDIYSME